MNISTADSSTGDPNRDRRGRPLRSLVNPFATAIFAAAQAHRAFGATLRPAFTKGLMDSILDEIRGAASVHTHGVSRCAATEAHRRGIDRLSAKTLRDQPDFDPDGRVFVVEHMVSVAALVHACMCQPTREDVEDVLMRRLSPVWLLRHEHDVLAKLGCRARLALAGSRVELGDHAHRDALYRHAGIVLLGSHGA